MRAERGDVLVAFEQVPEPLGAELRERVLDPHGAAKPLDLLGRVRALDAVPAGLVAQSARGALPFGDLPLPDAVMSGLLVGVVVALAEAPGTCTRQALLC